jgi:signal transduction histidine kinase/ActR/RegA family two-component response regulator
VIGLFFYHLFLLFLTKEKVQFFYILYVGCTLLFFASQQGSLFQFWPHKTQWNHLSFYSFSLLALSSGLFFSRLFLNTKNNITLHKWMKYFAIALSSSSILHIFVPTSLVAVACSIFGLLLIIALFMIALRRYIEGFSEATLFIIAWGFLLIVVATMIIMMNLGMGNINIAMLLAQLAFAAQQVLLSIGLAQRINSLKREKEQTEKEIAIAQAENKAKTDFLARMSHEIRTPMNAVLGVTQLLENTSLTDVQQHYINLLKNSGKLLISIINDILDYAKINSGNLNLEHAVFDLPKLLLSTQQIMVSNLKNKQIELIFDIDNNLPQWVEADPTRLQQILFNLLSNALKFTQKGSVRLEVRQLFQMNKDTSQLQITITDTGIGLSSEQLKNLFSAFHQADASITRKYGGTGLGLAISKQLIDLMRGSIKVHSQVNQGTTFIILLPVKIANEIANTTSPILPALGWGDFSKLRVLLVEDNSINQLIISSLLNQLKIEPHLANNGEEAIDFIQQHHNQLDVVLMDCEMPILDGLEATRKIRDWEKNHQQAPIPIIALTAHALPEYKERCLAVGMTDYLSKPLLLEQLMNKLLNIQKSNA